jgi:hypothetical protein
MNLAICTIIVFLDIIHRPVFLFKTHNVVETGFYLCLQVEPTHLGPIDRASPYLPTPAPTQDFIYPILCCAGVHS